MLAKRILPCLDVKAGRVVKGVNFVDLKDAGDPVELAKIYNEAGADELVFLDITATHEDRGVIYDVVQRTAEQVFIPLTVGGGISSVDTIKKLLRAGADKVSINSAAVRDPDPSRSLTGDDRDPRVQRSAGTRSSAIAASCSVVKGISASESQR